MADSSHDASSAAGAAAAADRVPSNSWVMLDPCARLNSGKDYPEHRHTYAEAFTSAGDRIGVFFRSVAPPGASRLYVSWKPPGHDEGDPPANKRRSRSALVEPRAVAAHGDSILLEVVLGSGPTRDFFLYRVPSDGRPPSLRRLPACDRTMAFSSSFTNGLINHMLRITNIGLLRRHGEFVVADLLVLPETEDFPLELQFCIYSSSSPHDGGSDIGGSWEIEQPPGVRHEPGLDIDLRYWETDVAIPYGESLCYVDYCRGILFANNLLGGGGCPELRYVRLPVPDPTGCPVNPEYGVREAQHLSRAVGVTRDGVMRFVEVVTTTVFVSGHRLPVSSSFTVSMWRLRCEDMTWEKESDLRDVELWGMQGYGDLPRVEPELPVVSMEEPGVIYLVLRNDEDSDGDAGDECGGDEGPWMVVVDMLNKTLQSSHRYANIVDGFSDHDGDMESANIPNNESFIPCELASPST